MNRARHHEHTSTSLPAQPCRHNLRTGSSPLACGHWASMTSVQAPLRRAFNNSNIDFIGIAANPGGGPHLAPEATGHQRNPAYLEGARHRTMGQSMRRCVPTRRLVIQLELLLPAGRGTTNVRRTVCIHPVTPTIPSHVFRNLEQSWMRHSARSSPHLQCPNMRERPPKAIHPPTGGGGGGGNELRSNAGRQTHAHMFSMLQVARHHTSTRECLSKFKARYLEET